MSWQQGLLFYNKDHITTAQWPQLYIKVYNPTYGITAAQVHPKMTPEYAYSKNN